MNMGGKVIEENIQKGQELALVTKDDTDQAQQLIDANAELILSLSGIKNKLSGELTPALIDTIKYITYFIQECKQASLTINMFRDSLASGETPMFSVIGVVYQMSRAFGFLSDAIEEAITDYKYWSDILSGKNPMDRYNRGTPSTAKAQRALSAEAPDTFNLIGREPGDVTYTVPPPPKEKTGGEGGTGKTPAEIKAEEQQAQDERNAKELVALQVQQDAKLNIIRDSLKTNAQLEEDAWGERLGFLIESGLADGETQADRDALIEQAAQQHQDRMRIIEKRGAIDIAGVKKQSWLQQLYDQNTAMGKATADMRKNLTVMFGDNKTFALGMALIDAYGAITASYKMGAQTGIPGMAEVMAGIAAAAQFKIISDMRSVQPGSSGGGGGMGGGGKVKSAPEQAALPAAGTTTGGTATINIVGGDTAMFTGKQVRDLITQINEQTAKGMEIVVR
jgi:hypothetical protein